MASPHVAGAVALYIAKFGRATDAAGTLAIKDALIDNADAQSSDRGFSGDKDTFSEPMLNVERFDPIGTPVALLRNNVSTDSIIYNTAEGDSTALISTKLTDEMGLPVTGFVSSDFTTTLNGTTIVLNFLESTTLGTYTASIDVTSLSDSSYNVEVIATNSFNLLTGVGSTVFTKTSTITPVSPKIFVSDISYRTSGGKSGDKNLLIDVSISDTDNSLIEGAAVSINLYQGTILIGSGTASTGTNGVVTFQLRNASAGIYTTTVTGVEKTGLEYDSSQDFIDTDGFSKP